MRTTTLRAALALLAAALPVSAQHSLLFTPSGPGSIATLSGSSGTLLSHITRRDLAVTAPGGSAEVEMRHASLDTLLGDKDCDGLLADVAAGGAIDAVTLCGNTVGPRVTNHFISVKAAIGAGLYSVSPGDVFSPRAGGAVAYMLTELQIRQAFAIDWAYPVDVDAVCVTPAGDILLSLEDDISIYLGAMPVLDGDLLMIPAFAITWAGCQAAIVAPGTGSVVALESVFDAMLATSGISDDTGAPVTAIGDLDGICLAPGGGTWTSVGIGPVVLDDLYFCGSRMTGGGVASTELGGSIALLDGWPLGQPAPTPTTGVDIGVVPGAAPVRGLDGLAIVDTATPNHFTLAAEPARPVAPATLAIAWGGASPGGLVAIAVTPLFVGPCGAPPALAIPNPGFGYWIGSALTTVLPPIASDPLGFGMIATPYAGGVPAGIAVAFQPATSSPVGLKIGGPAVMQF